MSTVYSSPLTTPADMAQSRGWAERHLARAAHLPISFTLDGQTINGIPDAVNHRLLTDILRKQWGFDGFVTDDLGAVALLTDSRPGAIEPGQRFSEDPVIATAAAIKAGNDSDDQEFERNIPLAVARGLLTTADVDRALSRVLRVGFRLGAFDPVENSPYSKISMDVVRSPAHLELALKTAQESLVLLKNAANFLPLKQDSVHSIAVIGPAGDQNYETGNYYGTPARKIGPLQGPKHCWARKLRRLPAVFPPRWI